MANANVIISEALFKEAERVYSSRGLKVDDVVTMLLANSLLVYDNNVRTQNDLKEDIDKSHAEIQTLLKDARSGKTKRFANAGAALASIGE